MTRKKRANGNGRAKAAAAARLADRREAARLLALLAKPDVNVRTRRGSYYTASIKSLVAMLDWSPTRLEDMWSRHVKRIDAWEMDVLRSRTREMFRDHE